MLALLTYSAPAAAPDKPATINVESDIGQYSVLLVRFSCMKLTIIYCLTMIFLCACKEEHPAEHALVSTSISAEAIKKEVYTPTSYSEFSRDESYERLKAKIAAEVPLVVHVMVALCDNEHQGIVPVNERLGNGLDLKTNLYWGALYGLKHHFSKSANWALLKSDKDVNPNILERLVLQRTYPNGAKVFLVADAFRGDRMKECLVSLFDAVSGRKMDTLTMGSSKIGLAGNADLLVFNGHNGLMDYYDIKFLNAADQLKREVAVIGCASKSYFNPHLKYAGGYPLLMTTNLMAPEAYVLEGVLDSWAMGESGAAIRKSAGAAYHAYQKCGLKGATNLFSTGW